jgi:hypothetical protein
MAITKTSRSVCRQATMPGPWRGSFQPIGGAPSAHLSTCYATNSRRAKAAAILPCGRRTPAAKIERGCVGEGCSFLKETTKQRCCILARAGKPRCPWGARSPMIFVGAADCMTFLGCQAGRGAAGRPAEIGRNRNGSFAALDAISRHARMVGEQAPLSVADPVAAAKPAE